MSVSSAIQQENDEELDISCSHIRPAPTQMTLPLGRTDATTFQNFYPGPNKELIQSLESVAAGTAGQSLYI